MADHPGGDEATCSTLRAGLATWNGRAVLLAGPPGTGTSTLLDGLAALGATVLADGLVRVAPDSGLASGGTGTEPVAVDLVAVLRYDHRFDGRPWRILASPEVAHELIGCTLGASDHPARTRDAAHAIGRTADGIGGRRGEAADTARALIAHLDARGEGLGGHGLGGDGPRSAPT